MIRRVRPGYHLYNMFVKHGSLVLKQPEIVGKDVCNSFCFARCLESTFQTPRNFQTLVLNWTCESCGKSNMRYILMCSKCQRLINPIKLKAFTYFEILDQENTFDLNISALSVHFRRLQNHLHPDKFVKKDEVEQARSLDVSALVNAAYQTLLKPIARATYLLELRGKPFEEKSVEMDQEFLLKIMEANETVSACESLEEARVLKDTNDRELKCFYGEISDCFKRDDLDGAMLCLAKLTYFENVNEKLKDVIMKHS